PVGCEICDHRGRYTRPLHRLSSGAQAQGDRPRFRQGHIGSRQDLDSAGASGIACGVIRNNYFQPAMRELMAHSVSVWETDPKAYSYNPVGYMQISPEKMHADVAQIAREQKDIGYESVFIEGEADSLTYMRGLFDDWQAKGI